MRIFERQETTRREIEALRARNSFLNRAVLRINDGLDLNSILRETIGAACTLTATRFGIVTTVDKAGRPEEFVSVGLTLSDAVRILMTRVAAEGGLPAGLAADPEAHDAWFRAKAREALDDPRPALPHEQAMTEIQALIDGKRRRQA